MFTKGRIMLEEVPRNTDDHDRSFDSRVKQKRNVVFYSHAAGNMPSFVIGALFLGFVLWEYNTPEILLISWLSLAAFAALVTLVLEKSVRKTDTLNASPCERWVKQRLFLGGVNTFIFGITPLLLPQDVAPAAELYLFIILTTLVSLASVAYSTIPNFIYLLCIFALGPLAAYFFIKADHFHIILGLTTLIWSLIVLRKAAIVSHTTIEQIIDSEKLEDEIRRHEVVKQQIKEMAHYDLLTGIANRRLLESMINRSINRAKREGSKVGFIIIDLDNFKPINDEYGHQAGDTVLKHVASNLSRMLRSSDLVARIGGDEFCIVLEDAIDQNEVEMMLSKLAEVISLPVSYFGNELSVEASLGYSQLPEDGENMDSLIRAADMRMYESKRERKLIPAEAI
jgi:diguanylate cyclase (GGDEF)-like protein